MPTPNTEYKYVFITNEPEEQQRYSVLANNFFDAIRTFIITIEYQTNTAINADRLVNKMKKEKTLGDCISYFNKKVKAIEIINIERYDANMYVELKKHDLSNIEINKL